MTTPMTSAFGRAAMRRLQHTLFQTGLDLAEPHETITFSRYDRDTTSWVARDPQRVLVRFFGDKGMIRRLSSDLSTPLATSQTAIEGVFTAFEPFDAQVGDRFTLDGLDGHLMAVWPARNGKRRASFVIESERRTGP